jgi:CubicO group peptidase (beta-lactamase class C family)/D-alanyl-D-alanine dipeptidase
MRRVMLFRRSLWQAAVTSVVVMGYAATTFAVTLDESRWKAIGTAVLAAAERERAMHEMPSIAVGLVDRNGLAWSGAVGHVDAEGKRAADARSLYRIGSISKLFTDVLVMQQVQGGKLDLDAPVERYLPGFAPRNPFGKPITLRQLMSHRSGLVREPPRGNYFDTQAPSLEETVRSLNSTALVAAPGTVTKYSNAGIAVVGRVLEVVTRKPFDQLMREMLLDPLGMKTSAQRATADVRKRLAYAQFAPFDASRFAAPIFDLGMAPAGNLYASVEDLAKFATSLLNNGASPRGRILERATLDQMWTPQRVDDSPRTFGIGFALDTFEGHRVVGHSGAVYGYATTLSVFPDDGFAVIVMVTLDDASPSVTRLRTYAARQVLAALSGGASPPYATSDAITADLGRKIAGHYSDGANSLDIRWVAEHAYLEAPGVAEELRRLSDRWVLDGISSFRDDVSINADAGEVTLGTAKYRRLTWAKPSPPPAEFASLVGEYGWEHNYLQVYERDGQPYVRIEWSSYEPLQRVSKDVYAFKNSHGLYGYEQLHFTRAGDGSGRSVSLNGIVFERRDFGEEMEAKIRADVLKVPGLRAQALAARPPVETAKRPADLAEIVKVEPGIKLDVRYASTNNFMGIPFYESARAFLQRPAAEALARAHRRLAQQGYGILVHDGYRPWYVTKMFWEATPPGGRDFVADPSQGSRHNRGCAADITLYDASTGRAVVMPGRYDEMSARSSPLYVGGTSLERWRRDQLKAAVEAEGFDVYQNEWWHFDYRDWQAYPILNQVFSEIRPK